MKKLTLKIAALIPLTIPAHALAATSTVLENPPTNINSIDAIIEVINKIAAVFFTVFIVIAVIFFLLAAFQYLTSSGDTEKTGKAKNTLIYAVVAVVVALLAGGLVSVIRGFIGA